MKREEEIFKVSREKEREKPFSVLINDLHETTSAWRIGFIEGAEWADRTMIEKACEWLDNNLDDYLVIEENNYEGWSTENACYVSKNVYHDFRNAMQ